MSAGDKPEMPDVEPSITESLLSAAEQFMPLFEVGAKMRRDLEGDGWSPTAAESLALEYTLGCIRVGFAQAMPKPGLGGLFGG